jgi:hypothetical protein
MDASVGIWIGLGLATAAWIGAAVSPSTARIAAGWVFAIIGTVLLVLAAASVAAVLVR